ncbi:MAG: arginase family protein [Dehalococcoidales bacterium]|nr:arginase family protein [Dehalococcoidales bacterium]
MAADTTKLDWLSACPDPYAAVTGSMSDILKEQGILPYGRFPVPSWLWPKPNKSDLPLVNVKTMADFFDSGSLLSIVKQLQSFVADNIFPEIPIMIGIDHSATAGVVSALADKYGPKMLTVVVLDQHFDAIPLSIRLAAAQLHSPEFTSGGPHAAPIIPIGFSDQFCCGNFWSYLIDEGSILPENLLFIGVGDYPDLDTGFERDSYKKYYLSFEERGCSFFPLKLFGGQYIDSVTRFLSEKIDNPYVYISLDLDVGSYNSVYAARYMDKPGISKQNLLDVANIIASDCRRGKYKIVGLDIMEFNMHFLGIETPGNIKDSTLSLVAEFIKAST